LADLLNICDVVELDDFIFFRGGCPGTGTLETQVTKNTKQFYHEGLQWA